MVVGGICLMDRLPILLATFLSGCGLVYSDPGALRDYCEDAPFLAECPDGEVVLMQEAIYGRMQLGVCLLRDYGSIGCSSDVLAVMDRWCSGRQSCSVQVRDLLDAAKPCPRDLRGYLQARYTCIPVVTPTDGCCATSGDRLARIQDGSGFIASSVTETTGCGSIDCPWLLEAPKGQKINISVYDFAIPVPVGADSTGNSRGLNHNSVCFVYAIIKEQAVGSTMTLCAGEQRHKHVYTTTTNSAEIRIVTKKRVEDEDSHFMIQFDAFGCPDPTPPSHGHAERHGSRAVIGCLEPDPATWEITCREGKWHGFVGNCTAAVSGRPKVGSLLANIMHLSPDVSIVIITLVAVTIALGILVIGVVCLRRRWGHNPFGRKQPKQPMPPGGDRRESSYSARGDKHSISVDPTMTRDHNYFRTWELPRHLPRRPGTHHDILPDYPQNEREYDTGYYTDHIYESPTFERRDFVGEDGTKYYELDPEAEPFNPSSFHKDLSCGPPKVPPQRGSYPVMGVSERPPMTPGSFTS